MIAALLVAWIAAATLMLVVFVAWRENAWKNQEIRHLTRALVRLKLVKARTDRASRRRESELLDEIDGLHAQIATHHCAPARPMPEPVGELRHLRELLAIVAARQPHGILRISPAELDQIERGATISTRTEPDGHFVLQVLVPAALPRTPGITEG